MHKVSFMTIYKINIIPIYMRKQRRVPAFTEISFFIMNLVWLGVGNGVETKDRKLKVLNTTGNIHKLQNKLNVMGEWKVAVPLHQQHEVALFDLVSCSKL